MNIKNVVTDGKTPVKKELQCALCHAILVQPMKCKDCKQHYDQACLNKFCRETGACPLQCKKPKFVFIAKEVEKALNDVKFTCVYKDLGCEQILTYQQAMNHDKECPFGLVKCDAYSLCKTRCLRKEIGMH